MTDVNGEVKIFIAITKTEVLDYFTKKKLA